MNKPVMKIKLFDEEYDCYLEIARYMNNNNLYLGLYTDEEPFTDITINLNGYYPSDEYIYLDGDITNEVKSQLKKYGILKELKSKVSYNMGTYDCYQVDLDKIKYYDPIGYDKYEVGKYINNDYDNDISI